MPEKPKATEAVGGDAYPGSMNPSEYGDILSEIYSEMPRLKPHGYVVKRVDGESGYGGSIEFMSPDEPKNPTKNTSDPRPYIEIYSNAPTERGELKKLIWGDMLHRLSDEGVDPEWRALREEYMGARDDKQKEIDEAFYTKLKNEGRENRKFEDWMNYKWADASVREPLKGNKEWLGFQTPKQKEILERMKKHLATEPSFQEAVEMGLKK